MREDLRSWTPHEQARMLDLLQQADPEHSGWWMDALVGKMPESAME